jgi:serine/threonine-protein kinase
MPILTPRERLGTLVGERYRIERVFATGGMSVLFEAYDTRACRSVALKLLKPEDCVSDRRVERFLQEMRLTAQLRNPHVVDVLDLGHDEQEVPYLVMELLQGRSLQAELNERKTLGVEETLAMLLPVMGALAAVHGAGVVHRDVKPDNIFLHIDLNGRVTPKLLDFGIAKAAYTTLETLTGAVLGTPEYMAPEQVLGEHSGPATDIWAMGAVMYKTLSGETPFQATTAAQVLAKLAREAVPPLRAPGVPASLAAAVDRSLVRDPAGRYSDMREFAGAVVLCAREAGFSVAESWQPSERKLELRPPDASSRRTAADSQAGSRAEAVPYRRVAAPAAAVLSLATLLLLAGTLKTNEPGEAVAIAKVPAAQTQLQQHASALAETAPMALSSSIELAGATRSEPTISSAARRPLAVSTDLQSGTTAGPARRNTPGRARARRAPTAVRAAEQALDAQKRTETSIKVRDLPVAIEW